MLASHIKATIEDELVRGQKHEALSLSSKVIKNPGFNLNMRVRNVVLNGVGGVLASKKWSSFTSINNYVVAFHFRSSSFVSSVVATSSSFSASLFPRFSFISSWSFSSFSWLSSLASAFSALCSFLFALLPSFLCEEIGFNVQRGMVTGVFELLSGRLKGQSDFEDGEESFLSYFDETFFAGFPDINNLAFGDVDNLVKTFDSASDDFWNPEGFVHESFCGFDGDKFLAFTKEESESTWDILAWMREGLPYRGEKRIRMSVSSFSSLLSSGALTLVYFALVAIKQL